MIERAFILSVLCFAFCSCKAPKSHTYTVKVVEEETEYTFNETYTTMEQAEDKLIAIYEDMYDSPFNEIPACNLFEFVDFVQKEPRTIDYPFTKLLSNENIGIETSEDGNLRLYYWRDGEDGNWSNWSNMYQYRSGDKVCAAYGCIADLKEDVETHYEGCIINGIKTIYDEQKNPIYLVNCYWRESGNWGSRTIEALQIKDGELCAAPIFHGGQIDRSNDEQIEMCYRGFSHQIADWYFRANDGEGWDYLFRYDDKADILYIPQAEPYLSDRYDLYRNTNGQLYYIGTDGGFWLHPTLRSFEFLESIFLTQDYRIRVDLMYDQTYRYAAWKNRGSMDCEPDIIIYNGRCTIQENDLNTDKTEFRFTNNSYEYIVNMEQGLTIKHNGKVVMHQKRIRE